MKKRRIAICLIIALLVGLISNSHVTVSAQTDTNPAVTVTVNKKIDVALSVGATGVDYSGFSKDLKAKLLELGQIPEEDINISELVSQSVSTSNSSFKWWVYDHTIGTPVINDSTNNYTEKTESQNEQGGHPYYNKASHIETTNNGADLFFMGYGSSAYKDFMYLENNDPTTKTFQFDIIENEAYDALDGVGFLFNTTVTGNYENETQKMSGYLLFFQYGYDGRGQEIALYKFDDLNTKNFHHLNDPATIDDTESFKKLGSSTVYSSDVKYRKIKIEAQPSNVKVWYKGSTAEIKDELNESDIVSWT
ncbi:MAG: S-layer domain protein, partial [Anaerocolumna sp.]|nr:S-layer domain protein [Anaerocolumna sp.]